MTKERYQRQIQEGCQSVCVNLTVQKKITNKLSNFVRKTPYVTRNYRVKTDDVQPSTRTYAVELNS